ncbi:MAG: hypothetical protein KGK01_12220 [Bradyrhizobium sp.]|uniref:hypothetical protein n=1 Tax=Bradyrhizobium sp. TaxID=376 RepID=UPI001C295203|nr:hypothetical protein [Bradyrhizobium sp.]MBU6464687.1 hypothetical protein [Pseudomonadota bacterium]MDE2068380.1 hypothetical protein [Bradyrhizobium sp.]MDE2243168.1 hypothetical protein [Bradyrhizobium sp.]MDE2472467.1 hypothetical protein [Bradyrhizobium sp.]
MARTVAAPARMTLATKAAGIKFFIRILPFHSFEKDERAVRFVGTFAKPEMGMRLRGLVHLFTRL